MIAALLLAAGRGERFGAPQPKQYALLLGRPVLRLAAEALLAGGHVQALQPVCAAGEEGRVAEMLQGLPHLPPVIGGATRQASVKAGLAALAPIRPSAVLVHDAARPVIPEATIPALLAALQSQAGAIPAQPVSDTLKRGDGGLIGETVPRTGLFRAQTPQAFRFETLRAAHAAAQAEATDDAQLLEWIGETVALVAGHESNVKITFPEDLARVEATLLPRLLPRIGTGYDVHRLVPGRPLILCGVTLPHELGLDGHSDADVTLICEQPKIGPYAGTMIARLAELMGVETRRIGVKATTTERLGFTGRAEGIACQAAVSLLVPD